MSSVEQERSIVAGAIHDRDVAEAQVKILKTALHQVLKKVSELAQVHDPATGFCKPVNASELLCALHPGYSALLIVGYDDV